MSDVAERVKKIVAEQLGVKEEVTTRGKVIQGEVQQTAADTRRAAR